MHSNVANFRPILTKDNPRYQNYRAIPAPIATKPSRNRYSGAASCPASQRDALASASKHRRCAVWLTERVVDRCAFREGRKKRGKVRLNLTGEARVSVAIRRWRWANILYREVVRENSVDCSDCWFGECRYKGSGAVEKVCKPSVQVVFASVLCAITSFAWVIIHITIMCILS